jgi:hypothetical protein
MSSPSEASHADSGKFTTRGRTDKALHGGHLFLHGDYQAQGRQIKNPRKLAGKIYNERSVD